MSVCAQKEVVVRPVPNGDPAPTDIPVVTYNDSTISITSDSTIINSHIVIRNMFGGVLYQATTDLGQNQTVISLSEQDNKTKHSIELYCDDKYLQGFFENE